MSYGLSIYNSNGTQIISEEFSSYYIIANGVSANGQMPNFYGYSNGVQVAGNGAYGAVAGDILYIRPHALGYYLYNDTVGSSSYPPQIQPASSSGYVEWVLTRKLTNQTGSDPFGLRIFRSDGTTAYDSQIKGIHPVFMARDTANENTFGNFTTVTGPYAPQYGRKRFIARGDLERLLGITSGNGISSYISWGSDGNSFGLTTRTYPGWSGQPDHYHPGTLFYLFCDILV